MHIQQIAIVDILLGKSTTGSQRFAAIQSVVIVGVHKQGAVRRGGSKGKG